MIRAALAVLLFAASTPASAQGYVEESPEDLKKVAQPTAFRGTLPRQIDISATVPPPRSQGEAGTCTSWAATYAAASHVARRAPNNAGVALSPTYTYNQVSKDTSCATGTNLARTLDLLRDEGALPLTEYAYDAGWCGRMPTTEERARAKTYRIPGWRVLSDGDLDLVKGQLAKGVPVLFSTKVGAGFKKLKGDAVWQGEESTVSEPYGHAMLLVGYDDAKNALRLQNSWGKAWADGGYAWISYDYWRRAIRVAFVIE